MPSYELVQTETVGLLDENLVFIGNQKPNVFTVHVKLPKALLRLQDYPHTIAWTLSHNIAGAALSILL